MATTKTVEGIDLLVPSPWDRDTIADGVWLNSNSIEPIFNNDSALAYAIAKSSAAVMASASKIYWEDEVAKTVKDLTFRNGAGSSYNAEFDDSSIDAQMVIPTFNESSHDQDRELWFGWNKDNGFNFYDAEHINSGCKNPDVSGSNYINVQGVTNTKYVRQTKQPADWLKNYSQYYYYTSDGVTAEYRNTEGASYYTYPLQSMRPSDWWSNFAAYFRKATARELRKNKKKTLYAVTRDKKGHVPAWKAKTYHTKVQKQKAPVWKEKTRYTRVDTTAAPAWSANTYYQQVGNTAPAWSAGTYYLNTGAKAAPEFVSGKYFRKCIDHYAVMVAGALEKLAEYHASDDLSIDLEETDQTYDVGDIVGTREEITGMEATQEVIKKIITISNDDIVIRYEVG